MGCVMSYATGLGPGRPSPAGILAMSGFIPTVDGWEPELGTRGGLPVLVTHGARDPVIGVEFARDARRRLEPAGLALDYHEHQGGHHLDPATAAVADRVGRAARGALRGMIGPTSTLPASAASALNASTTSTARS